MSEVESFLSEVIPRFVAVDTALHNGDARPRHELWSSHDPVSLFGAAATESGWAAIRPVFDKLAATFSDCTAFRYDVMAAGVSGDLAYVVGTEHTVCSVNGQQTAYSLRVTTIL